MREHMGLYRGKTVNGGEWVEGNLAYYGFVRKPFIVAKNSYGTMLWFEVDPDTVGECCGGLRDKNGKLIFEGDIVRCGTGRICKVTFFTSPGFSGFDLDAIGGFDAPPPHDWVMFADTEIIGNAADNPELLKGGEQ